MRRKSLFAGAIAIAGVLAVGVPVVDAAASTAATSPGATTITCTFKNYSQTPKQLSGFSFAYVSCRDRSATVCNRPLTAGPSTRKLARLR